MASVKRSSWSCIRQCSAHLARQPPTATRLPDRPFHRVCQPYFPEAQSGIFANLIRWYDFLSHTADPANIVPKVRITKAPFRMPPPPPLAPKVRLPCLGHVP